MKIIFFALFVVVSGKYTPFIPVPRSCPSVQELRHSSLISKVHVHSQLPLLLEFLHDNCVDLNRVNKVNQQLSNIFSRGEDQEPALAKDLNALLEESDNDKRGIVKTQIAAIAEAFRVLQLVNIQDVNNYAFEHFVGLVEHIVGYAKDSKAVVDQFRRRLEDLRRVADIRDFIRQEPFRGLQLNNQSQSIISYLLVKKVNPQEVLNGIQRALIAANVKDLAYVERINKKNVYLLQIYSRLTALGHHDSVFYFVREFADLMLAYSQNQISKAAALTKKLVKELKNKKALEGEKAALDRQVQLVEYVAKHVTDSSAPTTRVTKPAKTTRSHKPTRPRKTTRPHKSTPQGPFTLGPITRGPVVTEKIFTHKDIYDQYAPASDSNEDDESSASSEEAAPSTERAPSNEKAASEEQSSSSSDEKSAEPESESVELYQKENDDALY